MRTSFENSKWETRKNVITLKRNLKMDLADYKYYHNQIIRVILNGGVSMVGLITSINQNHLGEIEAFNLLESDDRAIGLLGSIIQIKVSDIDGISIID